LMWPIKDLKALLSSGTYWPHQSRNFPPLICVSTTAGTGSEAGKSSVISDLEGVKYVIGHPTFMPLFVALDPQLTTSLPAQLTSSTAVDAFFHCLEALMVTQKDAYEDGCDDNAIQDCDHYAMEGMKLILRHLPIVLKEPTNLQSRLALLVAASLGAKAFRKGSLGAVHSTAHSLSFASHLHHGTAIARMSFPVTHYNEELLSSSELKSQDSTTSSLSKFESLYNLFDKNGFKASGKHKLSTAIKQFVEKVGLKAGISDLLPSSSVDSFLQNLAVVSSKDGCQTNMVPLKEADYRKIFDFASKY